MTNDELIEKYPQLFHMAWAGSWAIIAEHGLWTTEQIVNTSEGAFDDVALRERRARSVVADHPVLGAVTIRDQAPLRLQFLQDCLTDMSVAEWLRTLNNRVFFWLHPDKLQTLLGARLYRNREHDVLTVDTASLVKSYESNIRLSPINSGATLWPSAAKRGSSTFSPIADYSFGERARRGIVNAVTELAVIDGVPDIRDHIVRVERRRGTDVLESYPL